nr:immunoglobulin-like domain-containing protein [Lacticaseibacillus camelliae]
MTINVTADKPSLDVAKVQTTLKVGDQFDALVNVTTTSPYGEARVTVDGSVDTAVAGDYKLTYTATDKFGQTTTKEVTVTVAADDSADVTEEE